MTPAFFAQFKVHTALPISMTPPMQLTVASAASRFDSSQNLTSRHRSVGVELQCRGH